MDRINEAKSFILSRVHDPALANRRVPKKIKNKIKASRQIILHFRKVGDLFHYLLKFETKPRKGTNEIYDLLHEKNLTSIEDVVSDFKKKFANAISDITTLEDFSLGNIYSSWDIANFARIYSNIRGVYPIAHLASQNLIFVKVTFGEADFGNKWIQKDLEFRYFGGRRTLNKGPQLFRSIIKDSSQIYVFAKKDTELRFSGVFKFLRQEQDKTENIWFVFRKRNANGEITSKTKSQLELFAEEEQAIEQALILSNEELKRRISQAPKKPARIPTQATSFRRNPDVVVYVLRRAKGICENCRQPAPFNRASNGLPYLEIHHKIKLADGGEDTLENAIAVCPNCHRMLHYG